jgi:OHCU decarboxylase
VTLEEFNALPADEARAALLSCCGSRRWVQAVEQARPFATLAALLSEVDDVEQGLAADDWLEAFAAHPRIGERSASPWSQSEQAAALNAASAVQQQLAQANRTYEDKFGFIFIVFASGKSPEQMLGLLHDRMDNTREQEIENAAAEQRKITRTRLEKMLTP